MVDKDDDPLALKNLSLNYDYLIFKINDHITNLSEKTFEAVNTKQAIISEQYLKDQLHLEQEIEHIDLIISKCNDLELEFMKLDQLALFVKDFESRLDHLEDEYKKMN